MTVARLVLLATLADEAADYAARTSPALAHRLSAAADAARLIAARDAAEVPTSLAGLFVPGR